MKKFTFEVSDEEYDFLLKLQKEGYAEFRDVEYSTLDEFKNSSNYKDEIRTVDWFLSRNFDGTYHMTNKLYDMGLICYEEMSWHTTFILTKFAKDLFKNDKSV